MAGVSTQSAENIIKNIPRGAAVKIIAMSPPRDITQINKASNVKNDTKTTEDKYNVMKPSVESPQEGSLIRTQTKDLPVMEPSSKNLPVMEPPAEEIVPEVEEEGEESPEDSPGVGRDKDEGIVRVVVSHYM